MSQIISRHFSRTKARKKATTLNQNQPYGSYGVIKIENSIRPYAVIER